MTKARTEPNCNIAGSSFRSFAILCGLLLLPSALRAGLPSPWQFQTPLPQGNDLLTAWTSAEGQLYAGGHGGVILHWDGAQWTIQNTPTQKTIFGIHGTAATNIWAVGGDPYTDNMTNRCLILHFDGQTWKEQPPPDYMGYTYPFNSVHALAANDVWATLDGGTFLAHYDGAKWDWFSVPLSVEGSFRAITSSGANHLYVAGTHGQILHRDQGVWKLEQKLESGSMTFNIITRLWAFDPDHVFAAGNWTQFYRRNTDGTWAQLPVDASEPFGIGFCALWGRSPTEVYLLNEDSVFYYDGSHPAVRTSYRTAIRRQWLAGAGAGDLLYGVGPAGVAHEFRPDGQGAGTLSALTVGGHADMNFTPAGLAACGADDVLAYGFAHDAPGMWPLWHIANGLAQPFPSLPPGATRPVWLKAVSATSPHDAVVAWENWQDGQRGVHRWDGSQWIALPGAESTVALWRSPTGRLFAAGPARVQTWTDGGVWETLHTVPVEQPEEQLNALWGRTDADIFAATRNGKVLHYNGITWTTETTPGTNAIAAIAGNDTDTYAVGEDGLAWRRSGSAWQPLAGVKPAAGEHFSALALGSDGVYAAQQTPSQYIGGGLGRLWRFQGTTATLVVQGLSQPLQGLARVGSGHLVGFAAADFVVTTAPDAPPSLQRLDLESTSWQTVGNTGVALHPESTSAAHPVVSVQRVSEPAPFSADPAPYGEHWLIREDQFYSGTALPPMLVQIQYDPARLLPDLADVPLSLYRHTDEGVEEVPCLHDPIAHTLTTLAGTDFSLWTIGPATPKPTLTITPMPGGSITIAWPASAAGFSLYSTSNLSPDAVWTPSTATVEIDETSRRVTLDVGPDKAFYRLVAD